MLTFNTLSHHSLQKKINQHFVGISSAYMCFYYLLTAALYISKKYIRYIKDKLGASFGHMDNQSDI